MTIASELKELEIRTKKSWNAHVKMSVTDTLHCVLLPWPERVRGSDTEAVGISLCVMSDLDSSSLHHNLNQCTTQLTKGCPEPRTLDSNKSMNLP